MNKFFILLTLLISSCYGAALPPFKALGTPEVPGSPIFQKGFKQGCEAIASRRGTELFRHVYDYEFDTDLIDNPEYQFGWSRGWTNCFMAVVGGGHTLGGSADTYLIDPVHRSASSLFKIVGSDKETIEHSINDSKDTWGNPLGLSHNEGGIDSIWGTVQKGKDGKGTAFSDHPLWGTHQKGIFVEF